MRTISWTGLGGRPEARPAPRYRIVHGRAALGERLEPALPVPADVPGELPDERLRRPAAPVAAAEELDLEPPEEALHRRVVGRMPPPSATGSG